MKTCHSRNIKFVFCAVFSLLLQNKNKDKTMKRQIRILKGFLFSKRRDIYSRIAAEYDVSSFHVYKLAHGSRARSIKDERVLEELYKEGIISRIAHY